MRSHLGVIEKAKAEGLPYVLILEDDIRFCEGFDKRLKDVLSELPEDWDALWLGGQVIKARGYSKNLKTLQAGTGGYGVLFRETMYDDLVATLKKEQWQADLSYMKLQSDFKCFRTVENLILHTPGISTILKKYVSYPKLEV